MSVLIYYAMLHMLQPLTSTPILLLKPANSVIIYHMSMTIPNMLDIQQQQMISYIFA